MIDYWQLLSFVEEWICAAIPAVGFAILFNVPRRVLIYCAFLGGSAHVFRTLLIMLSMDKIFATFLTAAAIGFIGIYFAKKLKSHPKVFTIAAIIPMFPGIPAYRAMISVIEINNVGYSPVLNEQILTHFLQLSFLLGALATGLALPGLLFFRSRPMV